MAVETERKFLVTDDSYRKLAEPVLYRQGYLSADPSCVVRVRVQGNIAFLTVKGPVDGITRTEYEYEIPPDEAERMLNELCKRPIIEKDRYKLQIGGLEWEIDEFRRENIGLVVAEVNLDNERQKIELPDWIGREVSHDPRYFNSSLVKKPYNQW